MAEAKKRAAKPTEQIADVAHPGKSKPDGTSKPVIITNRPILKDPMVLEEGLADSQPSESEGEKITVKTRSTIKSLTAPEMAVTDKAAEPAPPAAATPAEQTEPMPPAQPATKPEPEPKPEPETKPPQPEIEPPAPAEPASDSEEPVDDEESDEEPTGKQPTDPDKEAEAKAAEQAKHDAAIETLVESKKYFLPINSVERRRSKRVVILGILLSVLLALAWADIALDAGLIQLNGVKPVTHFFSN